MRRRHRYAGLTAVIAGVVLSLTLSSTALAQSRSVGLVHADFPPFDADVRDKLLATGEFAAVDLIDAKGAAPAPAQLLGYDALLVWANGNFGDPAALGDRLADYVDAGGGVVVAHFAIGAGALLGRWTFPAPYSTVLSFSFQSGQQTLGLVLDPTHPLMAGVAAFDGGSRSHRLEVSVLHPDAVVIAEWSDGAPLVLARAIDGVRRVDLNFFPPSADALAGAWDPATDGVRLMTNALQYVGEPPPLPLPPPSVPENTAPVAVCGDVSASANGRCTARVNVDGGSFDPDGDPLTLTVEPPGPYPPGDTTVVLTAADPAGATSSCSAVVTVTDDRPPAVHCNAPLIITPRDMPASFQAEARDNCGGATARIAAVKCVSALPLKRGEKPRQCGVRVDGDTITIHEPGGVGTVIGWAVIGTDGAGNHSAEACAVLVVAPGKLR